MRSFCGVSLLVLVASACSSGDTNPYVTVPERGVRREVFHVAGVHPPDNPMGGATPSTQDFTQVVRYREDKGSPGAVSAVIIAMPGFLAGASTFDALARTLVRRGGERGFHIEVWAIDRRANLLEDTFGLEVAERRGDPTLAARYYRDSSQVDGRVFAGYPQPSDLPHMSEWGLATHVEDVRRVVGLVPQAMRKNHVFLMGHSLGGSFVEAYAGWVFESDGVRGADELAGVIMIDGILGATPSTESEYLDGSSAGGFPMPGLTEVRAGSTYTALPFLGVGALVNAEIAALYAHHDPNGVVADYARNVQLAALWSYFDETLVPPLTNLAALGLAFDGEHEPLPFVRASLGKVVGPTEAFTPAFGTGTLQRPNDFSVTYSWVDGPTEPSEFSSARTLAASMVHGESNFSEWYFPTRLPLDLAAVGGGTVSEVDYQATYGLRVFAGDQIDTPVLCIAAELVGDVAECDAIRTRVAPALGAGRSYAGFGRGAAGEDGPAFRVLDVTTMAHLDPLVAVDHSFNPVPAKIEQLITEHTGFGTFIVPVQPSPTTP